MRPTRSSSSERRSPAEGGELYLGCNVENASYGLSICAERNALAAAVAAGERRFTAMAIASRGGVPPCGACRQVLAELAPDLSLILVDVDTGERSEENLADLLPRAFVFEREPGEG